MKSTGEVWAWGKRGGSAGLRVCSLPASSCPPLYERGGVLISVNKQDRMEIVRLAKTLDDLGMHLYATPGTRDPLRSWA
jgi:hypothetical protein